MKEIMKRKKVGIVRKSWERIKISYLEKGQFGEQIFAGSCDRAGSQSITKLGNRWLARSGAYLKQGVKGEELTMGGSDSI